MLELENLKELRKAKGLSQMKVAREVGVNINTYIRWENCCSNPTEENLAKLEKIFN